MKETVAVIVVLNLCFLCITLLPFDLGKSSKTANHPDHLRHQNLASFPPNKSNLMFQPSFGVFIAIVTSNQACGSADHALCQELGPSLKTILSIF